MQHTVIGIFENSAQANEAAGKLRENGFSESSIDIASSHADASAKTTRPNPNDMGTDSPYNMTDESRYNEPDSNFQRRDTLNEDRIEERKISRDEDEGFGDSIGRFFRNLFDNKEEAEKYASAGRNHCIVSVQAASNDQAIQAADILDSCGAVDIDERTGSFRESRDLSNSAASDVRTGVGPQGFNDQDNSGKSSIPVIDENINIDKREVEKGSVRVRARIVERPVEENLRLREEHLTVERTPANRPATDKDFDTFREGEIEVTETAEIPVVSKEARVVEEVHLNKEVEERDETIRDTVRKTDVDVEDLEDKRSIDKGKKRK